ncbi:MAG: hypothetical protein H6Q78_637 [Candidatus Krumholzibacteriota bacterium]|nr:hypothetical protein [Candidatus Krumholzibacteriota bacterium]
MSSGFSSRGLYLLRKNVLLYGLLLVTSLLFFALVRNNTFWHSADFLYLEQSIGVDRSWDDIFVSAPYQPFQPLVKLVFYLEYKLFGLDATKYYLFNIFIHSLNALFVYFLVVTLLRDRAIAYLSSFLFACAVGNYGKAVMVVSGINDLLITMLTLVTLLFYFKNELQKSGRMLSVWFVGSIVFFVLSLLTKATSFSILGCMLAFHFFFRAETKRPVLNRTFITVAVIAVAALIAKLAFLPDTSAREDLLVFSPQVIRNFASYLVRMVFPIHGSDLVSDSGPAVQFVYKLATEIRAITFLCILSYSIFGFLFANRTIRFFIAWTYITVAPFCFFDFPRDWLNIQYLYLVSVGFIMILSSGTVFASRLLYQRRWRRFIPYALPVFFVLLSQFIITHLDKNYERLAATPQAERMIEKVRMQYESGESIQRR